MAGCVVRLLLRLLSSLVLSAFLAGAVFWFVIGNEQRKKVRQAVIQHLPVLESKHTWDSELLQGLGWVVDKQFLSFVDGNTKDASDFMDALSQYIWSDDSLQMSIELVTGSDGVSQSKKNPLSGRQGDAKIPAPTAGQSLKEKSISSADSVDSKEGSP
jgi:hypothetical protein